MLQKFTNKNVLIGIGIVAILIFGFLLFRMVSGSGKAEEVDPTPTPTPRYQKVDDSVDAELTMLSSGVYVEVEVTGIDGKYAAYEYELSYNTDSGPKGSIGRLKGKPIPLDPGQDELVIEDIRLGSCSTGGKCTDYTGVEDFTLVIKFYDENDEIFVFEKEFE